MKSFSRFILCGVAGITLGRVSAAYSADFTWLGGPSSALWNETDANWSGAGPVWANASTNSAVFGSSTEKSITADAVTLSNLTFTADGYTLGGGPLMMYGLPSVDSGVTATITATITNSGVWGLYKNGTVVLNPGAGTNFFYAFKAATGAVIHVTGGTNLVTQSGSNPESNPAFWVSGGTLIVGGGLLKSTGNMYGRVSDYGTLLVTNGYVDLTSYSELLNAHNSPGNTTVGGSGTLDVTTLRISQCNWSAASNSVVNVNTGGVLKLTHFGIDPKNAPKGMINLNGGTVVAKSNYTDFLGGSTNVWLKGIVCRVLEGGAVFDTSSYGITIKQPLVSGAAVDGGFVKEGAGTLALRGTNTYNGGTAVWGGALNIVDDNNLGAVPSSPATNLLFLGNATLQSSASHALAADRTTWITNAATATFDSQSCTQRIYGTVMCADTSSTFYKVGSGVVVLDPGPTAENTFGTLWTAAGTLVVASGTNYVTQYCNTQNGPGLRVSGGTLLVAGGVLMTTTSQYVNVDGGHLLVTNGLVDTSSCDQILNSIGSSCGYTTVSGSGTIWANQVRISQNSGNPSNSVINVNTGGVLRLKNFYIDINASQKGIVFLNGGTLEARVDNDNFFGTTADFVGNNNDRWLTNIFACVREGGAKVDTHGYTIGIKQPLLSGADADGGLTKIGNGSLTLYNTNTYNGATVVAGGTLKFGRNNLLPTGNVARAAAGGVLDVNGKTQTLAGIGGGGVITNLSALTVTGTIEPGDPETFGTLTLAGEPASMTGCTLAVNLSTSGACGCLYVDGDLDLTALSLEVADPEQLVQFKKYEVAGCTGTLSGPFASIGTLPARWIVKYDAPKKTAYLVYNFGTLIRIR